MAFINKFYWFFMLLLPWAAKSAEDYSVWQYKRVISLNTSASGADIPSSVLTGFPVLVRLTETETDVFETAKPQAEDLRFSKFDGTALPYEIESWDSDSKKAAVWVRLDSIWGAYQDQIFYMYWGQPGTEDSSNGQAVFGGGDFDTGNGYSGVWHLNSDLADASKNNPAAMDSGTTLAAGIAGSARNFNNPDAYASRGQYIFLGSSEALNISDIITMEGWIKWQSKENHRIVVCHGGSQSNSSETVLRVGEYQDYRTGVWNGQVHHAHVDAAPGDSNQWIHIAGVYDGSKWILYKNGEAVHDTTDGAGAQNSPAGWRIGAQWTGNGVQRFFHGDIDEVRISKTARSADWLKLGFENQKENQSLVTIGETILSLKAPFSTGDRPLLNRQHGWLFYNRNIMGRLFNTPAPINKMDF